MRVLEFLWQLPVGFLKAAWRLLDSIAAVLPPRRRQSALTPLEAERLDRIRNPSKYVGKS
jgi:hypothetical protein